MELDFSKKIQESDGLKKILAEQKTRKEINNLPDSDFAYIEPGGKKDDQGKTVPRSLRHLPIMDCAHVRNALARLSQTKISADAKAQALKKIKGAAKKCKIEVSESKDWDKIDKDELKHDDKKEKKEHYKDAVKDDEEHIKKLKKDEKIDKKKEAKAESEEEVDKKELKEDDKKEKKEHKKDAIKDDEEHIKKLKKDEKEDKKSLEESTAPMGCPECY